MSSATKAGPLHGLKPLVIAVLVVVAAKVLVLMLPDSVRRSLVEEGGLIEALSVLLYGVCLVLIAYLWRTKSLFTRWYFPFILTLMVMRELDLDKSLFSEGLLKSRQYIGDSVPVFERLLSLLLLVLLIWAVFVMLRRETRGFWRAIRLGAPPALAVLAGVLFMVGSKTIDGLGRKLGNLGVEFNEALTWPLIVIEEIGELAIPVMLGLAIAQAASVKEGRDVL